MHTDEYIFDIIYYNISSFLISQTRLKRDIQSHNSAWCSWFITFDCNIHCYRKVPSSILGAEIFFAYAVLSSHLRYLLFAERQDGSMVSAAQLCLVY